MSRTSGFWEFLDAHSDALLQRTAEHLALTGMTVTMALLIGLGLAVLTYRHSGLRNLLTGVCSIMQTIPGIALLVIMLALCGRIGMMPALFALVLYALLPIVQNTLAGLHALDPTLADAAQGIGLNRWQRLWFVRLPLALPFITAGLRTAAVQTVGMATLAAFIGAGGLGQFINRGLFLSDTRLILLGAVPAACLALVLHGILGFASFAATPARSKVHKRLASIAAGAAIAACALFTALFLPASASPENQITIGSKNFTEQLIVAEMVAQQIERSTTIPVVRKFGLGGSLVMHRALTEGQIDLAVEYTGTALSAILHQPPLSDPSRSFDAVRDAYAEYGIRWLKPLGFNNSYVLAIDRSNPRLRNAHQISDLATNNATLTAGFDFEFAERADGYAGLKKTYGLRFMRVVDMHPDLMYAALKRGDVDVISAYATDGRLADPGLIRLGDDRHFFPPYEAAIEVREATLAAHPGLEEVLSALSGRLTDARMRAANAGVDQGKLTIEQAARQLLNE